MLFSFAQKICQRASASSRVDDRDQSHWLFLRLEESSSLGRGGIFEPGTGGSESELVATSLFRVNARPRKPIAIKRAPPIISQCGNSIDESKPIYFFALGSSVIFVLHLATLQPAAYTGLTTGHWEVRRAA
jgi:hypothetical protein